LRGAEAIAAVIDYREGMTDDEQDVLITKCYTWRSALVALGGYSGTVESAIGVYPSAYKVFPNGRNGEIALAPPMSGTATMYNNR
jgi:hypothetical protein